MLDVKPYTFNNNILKAWLRCILLAEQVRKPNLWIAHNNTSFVREDLSDVVTSLAKHFKEGELTLTPGRMQNGVYLEPPMLTLSTRDYRVSIIPAYRDQHQKDWLGAFRFALTPAARAHRKADIKFSVHFDAEGNSAKVRLHVTPALDKLEDPREEDMAELNILSEFIACLGSVGYLPMLKHVYETFISQCYRPTDEKPLSWGRLRTLLNIND